MRIHLTATLLACLALPALAHAEDACSDVKPALAAMTGADQALRKRIDHLDNANPAQVKLHQQIMLVDRANTQRLKELVARCGWPSKKTHGEQAAGDAWLLAQHADQDLAFQKKVLALIEQDAASRGEGVDTSFAYLYDRVALAEKRPQRYGTQLRWDDQPCKLDFAPMEKREEVEARRAQLKLPPLDEYKRLVLEMQHCPAASPDDHHYAPPLGQDTAPANRVKRK